MPSSFGATPKLAFGIAATTSATTTVIASPFKSTFTFATNVTPKITPVEPEKPKESTEPAKPSPFASFTFGTPTSNADSSGNKSLSDIFGNLNKASTPTSVVKPVEESAMNKSTDDVVEEYEPSVDFKPVIPLPDLVEVKTGEENFETVYEHRAKLLRFDKDTKEWKDRGIGNIKISIKKDDPNTVRLLMRREQVLKLCCNQLLTKDLKFQKLGNNGTALSWVAHDYSENEMVIETFAIRFKTADICDDFHAQILKAQEKMGDVKAVIEEKKIEEKKDEKGFGDKFKPKAGSWTCEGCYLTNNGDALYCTACESPKDGTVAKKEPSKGLDLTTKTTTKFSFGMPAVTTTVQPAAEAKKDEPKGFGDQFKPKAGSWTCEGCYLTNNGDVLYCTACESPKDSTVPKKEPKNVLATTTGTKFSFGMPATGGFSFGSPATPVGATTTPAPSGFTFGKPAETTTSAPIVPTATIAPVISTSTSFTFSKPAVPVETETKPVFSFNNAAPAAAGFAFGMSANAPLTFGVPPSTNTVTTTTATVTPKKESFSFVFKPKSPKSPKNSICETNGDAAEHEDNDESYTEEENNTYFTPVIPLPDKVRRKFFFTIWKRVFTFYMIWKIRIFMKNFIMDIL